MPGKNATGVKEDFYILGLEHFQSSARAVRDNTGLIQHTADVSECLLITY
jgi:hypothetical protein